ncbi:C-type lectin domain family 4 member G-like isoform X2 [Paroedura picta]|uniref:C-type lectin domain family 4 member G-like isoform X2 n=1 Tax=Paroedura picta TaxID=143630 RepID=UPI0040577EAD
MPADDEEKKRPGVVYLIQKNKVYIICWLIAAASITAIVLVAIKYWELKERQLNVDYEFNQLRGSLAVAVNDPELLTGSPQDVAEEMRRVPGRLAKANRIKTQKAEIYEGIFHRKSIRSSPWHRQEKSRYYFSKGEKTWYDAEDFCSAQGAHLASVLNNKEQNFISSKLQRTSWIGLTTENEEGIGLKTSPATQGPLGNQTKTVP